MKKSVSLFFILVLSLGLLCACAPEKTDSTPTLWVLTEQSTSDGMNLQAKIIAERMEEKYDGLTVRLDILPTIPQEREILLKQLRTQIMAGKGPDVYLLPTGAMITTDFPSQSSWIRGMVQTPVEPLFLDVVQIMRDGYFRDLQPYYENDRSLNTANLKKEIMDAGVLDGSRYVLPLRFDIPVILTAPKQWSAFGLSQELLDSSAMDLTKSLLRQKNGAGVSAGIQLPADLRLLPRPLDYENETVLVTPDEIAGYMRLYQAWHAVSSGSETALRNTWRDFILGQMPSSFRAFYLTMYSPDQVIANMGDFNDLRNYIGYDMYWTTAGLPLYTCRLSDTLETVGIAKVEEAMAGDLDIRMVPLRAADGTVTASITYFGAVGCDSQEPALAYEFLRQFLTEEFQWDIYRPRVSKSAASNKNITEAQCRGQVEDSWPVRTVGSVSHLWDTVQYQVLAVANSGRKKSWEISRQIQLTQLKDSDLPALSWPIDEVRFPVYLKGEESIDYAFSLLNEKDGTPTDVDIDQLAHWLYQNLCYHLGEG